MTYSKANHLTKHLRVSYQIENSHNGDNVKLHFRAREAFRHFKTCSRHPVLGHHALCAVSLSTLPV